jgi:predicted signal transduction protein with EAL and GGDEF domain
MQGYFFARPMPADETEARLREAMAAPQPIPVPQVPPRRINA